jgi:protein ImuB
VAAAAPLTGEQGDLLSASWRDIGAADAALERLRTELGAGAIVRAEAQDTHRPERAGIWKELSDDLTAPRLDARMVGRSEPRPDGLTVGQSDGRTTSRHSLLETAAVRPSASQTVRPVLSLPESTPIATMARRALDPPEPVDVLCDGETPRVVTWRGHRITVTRALGPERLSGDWWDDGYRRDYWRCESLAGDFTVFLDRAEDRWALQGWGD